MLFSYLEDISLNQMPLVSFTFYIDNKPEDIWIKFHTVVFLGLSIPMSYFWIRIMH